MRLWYDAYMVCLEMYSCRYEFSAKDEIERDAWCKALTIARDSGPDPNLLLTEWKKAKECASLLGSYTALHVTPARGSV
jgi:hypothetical protein